MNEIVSFFKEKWNRAFFEKKDLENQVRIVKNELSDLVNREHGIEVQENNPDYIFHAECLENDINERILSSIEEKRKELKVREQELEEDIRNVDFEIERFKLLYDKAVKLSNEKISHEKKHASINKNLYDRLEFISGLMDSDIQRAKLELVSILKEEAIDAD